MRVRILFLLLSAGAIACGGAHSADEPEAGDEVAPDDELEMGPLTLPPLDSFLTAPSDRFLIDLAYMRRGHPFKGQNASEPHQGAHVHVSNADGSWPREGMAASNYMPIYAVADGVVSRIDTYHPVGSGEERHMRYGVDLRVAENDGGEIFVFGYSIEPFVDPGDENFYLDFLTVEVDDRVQKGEIIAYFFLDPAAGDSAHIHFELRPEQPTQRYAPSIFSEAVVADFHSHFNDFTSAGDDTFPPCMGYMLAADENAFGTGAIDCQ